MELKYKIYYATNREGPWTLYNEIPLTNLSLNSVTLTQLQSNTIYYIAIVPGELIDGVWYPYLWQPIFDNLEQVNDIPQSQDIFCISTTKGFEKRTTEGTVLSLHYSS